MTHPLNQEPSGPFPASPPFPSAAGGGTGRAVWLLPALLVALVGGVAALSMDVVRAASGIKGDEATYVTMALSVAHDGDLVYERRDLERVWRIYRTGPEGIFLKRGTVPRMRWTGAWPFVRVEQTPETGDRRLYFGKAFIYPLVASPLVRLFGINGLLLVNVLLLACVLALAARFLVASGRTGPSVLYATAFVAASVAPVYVVWLTPEVFNLACVFFAYYLWFSKEVSGGTVDRRSGLASDLAAAVLLGLATFSKPPNVLLIGPPVLLALWRRRFGRGVVIAAVFGAIVAAGFGANAAISGELNYQGGERKTFYGAFPFDASGQGFERRGVPVATDEVDMHASLEPELFWSRLAENLLYFVAGRHAGLVPYYFPAIVTLILCALAFRHVRLWQWLTVAAAMATAIALLVWLPFTWAGGGGPPGNRYFLSIYPVLLFATPPVRTWLPPVAAWLGGALFTAQILINPFVASSRPWQHTERGAARWLPVELTMVNDLPIMINGRRARVPYGEDPTLLLYFLDEGTYSPEPAGIWVAGSTRSEIIVRTGVRLERLTATLQSLVPNTVTLEAGGGERTVTIEPGTTVQVSVPVRATQARGAHASVLAVTVADGAVPALIDPGSRDGRFLGVLMQLAGVPARAAAGR